ncbi:Eco57I restriction-modification methylase domain-containing protein [Sanguibacter massiliensis]|uniref:Eco57I restriction-modification methylase domain-containing protein n=1 Tax=Sanguibacter massiliensis TaxID=1973217 RepID=UPI001A937ED8|nr:hypothetical protein [Sanguibacter massiliensis]
MNGAPLLPTIKSRSWEPEWLPEGWVAGERYASGSATAPFEVVVARASAAPRVADATRVWKARHGGRALDVLLVVTHGDTALVVGVSNASHGGGVPLSRVTACCTEAMTTSSPTALRSALAPLFASDPAAAEGLTNKGLFATHALTSFSKRHPDVWAAASELSRGIRERSGTDALTHLGWSVGMHGDAYVLRTDDEAHAVAVLLEGDEVFDRPSLRFGLGTSPVEHALALAAKQKVAWVQAVQGKRIRLYPVPHDLGVRRTGVTSYTEINLAHLGDDELGYVGLLLSPEALRDGGTAFQIVEESRIRATELGTRLRERIYVDVVPHLAEAVARRMTPPEEALDERGLADAYHRTLVILFRTLFVAYAEDRDLLPLVGPNAAGYDRVALKNRATEWARSIPAFSPTATDLWDDLRAIWSAVHDGSTEWGIPAYGGSIFDDALEDRPTLAGLTLTNAEIGPALLALLVDKDIDDEPGPVDFGALSVREFGTIYEGLLESSLSTAPVDLTLDAEQNYVPASGNDEVTARAGDVYFHNASGARKATGSYFTKEFAVEHLLSTSLEPTLEDHLDSVAKLLDAGRTADAAALFFDFRVADIAMGSGHFLVGALDVLARRMSVFLADHPIDAVTTELDSLRGEALRALERVGRTADDVALSQEALLRRQLAKRCLYGVDINLVAVELARLALWIHTFVPGLPMSSLDQHLIHGNSLTGIASTDELLEILEPGATNVTGGVAQSLFHDELLDGQHRASTTLRRAALLSEATIAETVLAEEIRAQAQADLAPVRAVYDVAFASRLRETFPEDQLPDVRTIAAVGWDALAAAAGRPSVQGLVEDLQPVHFPVAFPEVFDRDRPGFDVVLGNPPWEKVHVETHQWWGLRLPGSRSWSTAKRDAAIAEIRRTRPDLESAFQTDLMLSELARAALRVGPFPGIGSGHIDLYKAFCWRDWGLLREGGRAGVVFPRGAFSGSGTAAWRTDVIGHGAFDAVTFLDNNRWWVFDNVDVRYTTALTTFRRGGSSLVRFNGPFHSRAELDAGAASYITVEGGEFLSWSGGATFPLLPSGASASVFARLRRSPRFDGAGGHPLAFRAVQGDINATQQKGLLNLSSRAPAQHELPVLAGKSFYLWDPDFGEPYATVDRAELERHLLTKRIRQSRTSSSAFFGIPAASPEELPLARARIAFRDVTNQTNSRTVISALIPPHTSVTHKAPFLFRHSQSAPDEAYFLGVLSSIPLDWYARRFVELTLSFEILNALPIPRPPLSSPLRARAVEISGRLAAVDERFEEWAAEVGVPVGSVTDDVMKQDLVAELDALVSLLYDLERDDVVHIFETFHRGWDYGPRLASVLRHFDRWSDR